MKKSLYLEQRIALVREKLNGETWLFKDKLPPSEQRRFHQFITDCLNVLDGFDFSQEPSSSSSKPISINTLLAEVDDSINKINNDIAKDWVTQDSEWLNQQLIDEAVWLDEKDLQEVDENDLKIEKSAITPKAVQELDTEMEQAFDRWTEDVVEGIEEDEDEPKTDTSIEIDTDFDETVHFQDIKSQLSHSVPASMNFAEWNDQLDFFSKAKDKLHNMYCCYCGVQRPVDDTVGRFHLGSKGDRLWVCSSDCITPF